MLVGLSIFTYNIMHAVAVRRAWESNGKTSQETREWVTTCSIPRYPLEAMTNRRALHLPSYSCPPGQQRRGERMEAGGTMGGVSGAQAVFLPWEMEGDEKQELSSD